MGGMLLAPKLMFGMDVVGKTLYITWFRHRMIPHKVPETLIFTAEVHPDCQSFILRCPIRLVILLSIEERGLP
jgi:hypothetical protein